MTLKNSCIVKISKPIAENFMQRYEHLGNVGLGVWHWGLLIEGELVSVVSYGTPCFAKIRGWLGNIACKVDSGIVQLCRGATAHWSPKGTASRLVSMANKEVYKKTGNLVIVAYSDTKYCEIGTIYQACNAIYTGLTNPKGQANYVINGKFLSGWQVRKRYGTRSRLKLQQIDPRHQVLPLNEKHRYVFTVGPNLKKRYLNKLLAPYNLPYPKRKLLGIEQMVIPY